MAQKFLLVLGVSVVGAIVILAFAQDDVADLDLWGSMAMGRETLLRGWPPTQDPFSYVPTKNPLVYHEWLSGVVFYLVAAYLGGPALKVLMIVLGLLTVGFAAFAGRRLGGSYVSLLVVLVIAVLPMRQGNSPIRAQAFTWLFFAVLLVLLEEAERGRHRLLLLIPPITVAWANLHGGFIAGIGVLVLYIASHVRGGGKPWLLMSACVAGILGTLVNPYGLAYWRYLQEALTMPRPLIPEWSSLPLDLTSGWDFKALLLLSALILVTARTRYWPGIIVMAVTAFLGIRHVRHMPFFAIACLVYLPVHLSPLLDRVVESFKARHAVRPVLMTLLGFLMLGWLAVAAAVQLIRFPPWRLEVPANYYPVGAVEFVKLNDLRGNLATPYDWGEYVLWKLYPNVRVSFDARYETVYPLQVSTDNFNFTFGQEDWRRLLREYPTEMVLVVNLNPVARLMEKEPGWTMVYQDEISALYLPAAKSKGAWRFPSKADGSIP